MKIKQNKIAIIADLHLGIHGGESIWLETAYTWVKWLKDELNKHKIKDIIICGDIFHSRSEIPVNVLHRAYNIFSVLNDFNIIILCGNHDSYYKDHSWVNSISILANQKNIVIVEGEPQSFIYNGTNIQLVPWGSKLEQITSCDIMFGHFEINTFKMNHSTICEDGWNSHDLLEKSPLIFSGHFHLNDERKYKNKGEIIYVGNPFQMDLSDADSVKGYYILDVDTKKYQFHKNPISPVFQKVYLSEIIKKGTDFIQADKNVVRLIIDKDISVSEQENIIQQIRAKTPMSFAVDYDKDFKKFDTVKIQQTSQEVNIQQIIEEFIQKMSTEHKAELTQYVLDLYQKQTT